MSGGWTLAARAADAADDAPWRPLAGPFDDARDARAEATCPSAPFAPGDVLRVEGPGGLRQHWFARGPAEAVRLDAAAAVLDPLGAAARRGPLGDEDFGDDDWPSLWHGCGDGAGLLRLAGSAGVGRAHLARVGGVLLDLALDRLPPGRLPPDLAAAFRAVARAVAADAAGFDRAVRALDQWAEEEGALRPAGVLRQRVARELGRAVRFIESVREARERGALWVGGRAGEVAEALLRAGDDDGLAGPRAQAAAVRLLTPLGAVLSALTDPGRREAARAELVEECLGRAAGRVRLFYGDPATGFDDVAEPAPSGYVVEGVRHVAELHLPRRWLLLPLPPRAPEDLDRLGRAVDLGRVVRVTTDENDARELYRHPTYALPTFEVDGLVVRVAGREPLRFPTTMRRDRWLRFARGQRMQP